MIYLSAPPLNDNMLITAGLPGTFYHPGHLLTGTKARAPLFNASTTRSGHHKPQHHAAVHTAATTSAEQLRHYMPGLHPLCLTLVRQIPLASGMDASKHLTLHD